MEAIPFSQFRGSLQRLGGARQLDAETLADIQAAAAALGALPRVSRASLSALLQANPRWLPYLALCVGLSQEQLFNTLHLNFGTRTPTKAAREHAAAVVALLDDDFGLVAEVDVQRQRAWTFADVLVARYSSRQRAGGAIGRGRRMENEVEAIIEDLGLQHAMRGRFVGRNRRDAPCDLAIPKAGRDAAIVCAVKGFDSTGSKLTAAVTEIQQMADVRLPRQYVFAVVDGMGWLGRQADLRRLHQLWEERAIDGVFTLAMLADFRAEVEAAATRLGLLNK